MIDFTRKSQYGFADLVALVKALRAPGGCEWDRAQTHRSIRRNLLEEAYEACEAIDEEDPSHLREELGDVLLQVIFHADIESDAGRFDVNAVCDDVCRKLIQRHPHLFSCGAQRQDWEELKRSLRGQQTVAQAMEGVSKALPATWQADKILSKAEHSGLYSIDRGEAVGEIYRQLAALEQAADPEEAFRPVGEALFAMTALARSFDVDPEAALSRRCKDFIGRFSLQEMAAAEAETPAKKHTKK